MKPTAILAIIMVLSIALPAYAGAKPKSFTLWQQKWAEDLGVKKNYVTWSDGLVRID